MCTSCAFYGDELFYVDYYSVDATLQAAPKLECNIWLRRLFVPEFISVGKGGWMKIST